MTSYKNYPSNLAHGSDPAINATDYNRYVINKLKESRLSIKKRIEKLKIITQQGFHRYTEESEYPSAISPETSSYDHHNLDTRYPDNVLKLSSLQTPQSQMTKYSLHKGADTADATIQIFKSYGRMYGRKKAPSNMQRKDQYLNADIDHITLLKTNNAINISKAKQDQMRSVSQMMPTQSLINAS